MKPGDLVRVVRTIGLTDDNKGPGSVGLVVPYDVSTMPSLPDSILVLLGCGEIVEYYEKELEVISETG